MRAIVVDNPGGPDALRLGELPDPVPGPGEVLIQVRATAANRADTLQRMGVYPPPPGASPTLGLEASGTVVALGRDISSVRVGDRVCALLNGGGYAELVTVAEGQVMPLPTGMDLLTAGGLPEAFLTAHDNLVTHGRLERGDTVLVQGGGGGVGTAAIQIARRLGATVLTTAGSAAKLERCRELGATGLINHREDDVVARVAELTGGRGVDVILDVLGASHLAANLACLAVDGRLVVIGLQGGARAEIDLGALLRRRGSVIATTLRGRPPDQKAGIVVRAEADLWPGFEDGSLRVVVDRVLPLERAAEAHRVMEAGENFGKIIIEVGPGR